MKTSTIYCDFSDAYFINTICKPCEITLNLSYAWIVAEIRISVFEYLSIFKYKHIFRTHWYLEHIFIIL